MLELLLGQIPEAIYFALFMIFTKRLKDKRIPYITLMVLEYVLLTYFIKYNLWFQILYTIMSFIILKVLYKEKAQIIDVFTFAIASSVLVMISAISYIIVWKSVNNYYVSVMLSRSLLALFLLIFHKRLYKIQNLYRLLWNRNDKKKLKMKSATFRALNVVIFNLLFYAINLGILFTLFVGRGV